MNKLLEKQKLAFYYPYLCPSCKILCDIIVTLLVEFPDTPFKEIADIVKEVRGRMFGRHIVLKEAQKLLQEKGNLLNISKSRGDNKIKNEKK